MSAVRFYYFGRPKEGRHQGVITMAVSVDEGYTQAKFAMAFCSPRDQFCKERGRCIAQGRLEANRGYEQQIQIPKDMKPSVAICEFFNNALDRAVLPQWARDWVIVSDNLAAGTTPMRRVGAAPGGALVQETPA